jgi:hypothetical protein
MIQASPGLTNNWPRRYDTDISATIHDLNNYGDSDLWQYLSPESDENVATRGHISIRDRTSLDLKTVEIGLCGKIFQLTFRSICRDIPDLKIH